MIPFSTTKKELVIEEKEYEVSSLSDEEKRMKKKKFSFLLKNTRGGIKAPSVRSFLFLKYK